MLNPSRDEVLVSEHAAVDLIDDGMTIALGEPYPMASLVAIKR